MFGSLRSALLMFSAASASSVAPAQVSPTAEPLLASTSASVPSVIVPEATKSTLPAVDPLAPLDSPAVSRDTPEPEKPKGDLSSLVAQLRSSDPGSRELECLAVGVYFEAKSEPLVGQLAVGEVIANRASSGKRFPSSYCGVLFQRSQFSFIRGRRLPAVPRASRQWQTAVAIAKIVDQDLHDSKADKALFSMQNAFRRAGG